MSLGDFIKLLVAIVGGTSFICWAIYFSIFLPKDYSTKRVLEQSLFHVDSFF
jgi:hypothetical protein